MSTTTTVTTPPSSGASTSTTLVSTTSSSSLPQPKITLPKIEMQSVVDTIRDELGKAYVTQTMQIEGGVRTTREETNATARDVLYKIYNSIQQQNSEFPPPTNDVVRDLQAVKNYLFRGGYFFGLDVRSPNLSLHYISGMLHKISRSEAIPASDLQFDDIDFQAEGNFPVHYISRTVMDEFEENRASPVARNVVSLGRTIVDPAGAVILINSPRIDRAAAAEHVSPVTLEKAVVYNEIGNALFDLAVPPTKKSAVISLQIKNPRSGETATKSYSVQDLGEAFSDLCSLKKAPEIFPNYFRVMTTPGDKSRLLTNDLARAILPDVAKEVGLKEDLSREDFLLILTQQPEKSPLAQRSFMRLYENYIMRVFAQILDS